MKNKKVHGKKIQPVSNQRRVTGRPMGFNSKAYSMSTGIPELRDPIFNPESFYLAKDLQSQNRWIRYYDTYHPILPNSLDIHATFPISDFSFKGIEDPFVLDFYNHIKEDVLHLLDWVMLASREFEVLGEVFSFFGWDSYNGYYNSATILNPDLLEIYPFDWEGGRKYVISMDIPESFEMLYAKKDIDMRYRQLWNNLDPVIKRCVEGRIKIPLSPNNVFGMQRLAFPYDIRGTSQVLRCFVPGTKLFTGSGTCKNVEDFIVGDYCWTVEGKRSKVIDIIKTPYEGEMVSIYTPAEKDPIECTSDHKFPVFVKGRYCEVCGKEITFKQFKKGQKVCSRTCNGIHSSIHRKEPLAEFNLQEIVWKQAGELKEGDLLIAARQTDNSSDCSYTLDQALLLGYFLAEGCYNKTRHGKYSGITWTFHKNELDTWIKDVCRILDSMDISYSLYNDRDNAIKIGTLCSDKTQNLINWMREYAGEYSYSKTLPADVMSWPLDHQKEILKGFARGDGSIKTFPAMSMTTVSENLAYQFSRISTNLGLPHRLVTKEGVGMHRTSYTLLYQGSLSGEFIDECFNRDLRQVSEEAAQIADEILQLKESGLTVASIVDRLKENNIKTISGNDFCLTGVQQIIKRKGYGIQGKGIHSNMSVTNKYILLPVTKLEKFAWSDDVYCVTVEDSTHTISLRSVCTANCLKDLMYEDKLREAQMAVADGHITPYQIWKIGNTASGYIPTDAELDDWNKLLEQAEHQNLFRIVTHDAVSYEAKGIQEGLLPITPEMDKIEDRILTALYTSRAWTTGEGPTFSNAVIGLKVLEGRYQNKLYRFASIMKQLYKKIAAANEFYTITEAQLNHKIRPSKKDREYMIPQIHWDNYFSFAKDIERAKFYYELAKAHKISYKRVFEILGLDYDEEKRLLSDDMSSLFQDEVWAAKIQNLVKLTDGNSAGAPVGKGVPTNFSEPEGGDEGGGAMLEDAGSEAMSEAGNPPLPNVEEQMGEV